MALEANPYSQEDFRFAIEYYALRGKDCRSVIEFYVWCNLGKPKNWPKKEIHDLYPLPFA
jgi:hypothetical protein